MTYISDPGAYLIVSKIYTVLSILEGLCPINLTRGNIHKLYKSFCTVDATKYYFTNRIVNVWNSVPNCVVTAPTLVIFSL